MSRQKCLCLLEALGYVMYGDLFVPFERSYMSTRNLRDVDIARVSSSLFRFPILPSPGSLIQVRHPSEFLRLTTICSMTAQEVSSTHGHPSRSSPKPPSKKTALKRVRSSPQALSYHGSPPTAEWRDPEEDRLRQIASLTGSGSTGFPPYGPTEVQREASPRPEESKRQRRLRNTASCFSLGRVSEDDPYSKGDELIRTLSGITGSPYRITDYRTSELDSRNGSELHESANGTVTVAASSKPQQGTFRSKLTSLLKRVKPRSQ